MFINHYYFMVVRSKRALAVAGAARASVARSRSSSSRSLVFLFRVHYFSFKKYVQRARRRAGGAGGAGGAVLFCRHHRGVALEKSRMKTHFLESRLPFFFLVAGDCENTEIRSSVLSESSLSGCLSLHAR
ncbi:hypothetical protein EVAR_52646_1 [Eumeta japonica]|uniref:Uncharacterized protein n=1 Tax=Eumeta variegata TaxID=151549 RepID=A0A4C1Y265_EUMVA|nr:hypothetical protein EVAR_52646_1 [Eumeta japonica]